MSSSTVEPVTMAESTPASAAAAAGSGSAEPAKAGDHDLTSADYYFDSYGHFGIHEVSVSAANGHVRC